jgi:CRISPR/Cas system CMR-associated protein Cmr5 small subunit
MSRQQVWAKEALKYVTDARKEESGYTKKYKTASLKAASLVQRVGALQAVAFWMSRSDKAFRDFAGHLAKTWKPSMDADSLRRSLMGMPSAEYLVASRDLTEVAMWFRRMAQAELADIPDDDD